MYPNLYYAVKDLFGIEPWRGLRFFNSFGFFVAISFILAAVTLSWELRRKSGLGLLHYEEEKLTVGRPATGAELLTNFLLGFLLGYKFIGAFTSSSPLAANPSDYIFSLEGSWPLGIGVGLLFAGLKWWEKNKQKLAKPEERTIRIWPQDRVGDLLIYAAIFGFLGAKIFHNLENWNDLVKDPIGSLLSFSGLTFYGGLICAAAAIAFYARKHRINFWHLSDAVAPGLMLAYAVGRLGCQVSGDGDWGIINSAYVATPDAKVAPARGNDFTAALEANRGFYEHQFDSLSGVHHAYFHSNALPTWMVAYTYPHNVINEGVHIQDCAGQYCSYLPLPVFPTPLYETIVGLLLFAFLWGIRKRISTPGVLFGIYLIVNGLERFFVEKIRINTKYNIFGFHPTQAEIISFLLVVGGIAMIVYFRKQARVAV
ncbi:MAG: prolipoprotein diacylglyceryl transferase [Williamsia sp.]|nr:prolipoprotein diacylglyceryl transferase [Williamsia sp.]